MRPTNEETEKEKFKNYWTNFATKNKVYNPRFNYNNAQAAQKAVMDMKIVYSSRYKNHAKIVIDEVIRTMGSAQGYKEQAWGAEIEREDITKITDDYLKKYKLDVNYWFGKSLVTTMSGNGLSLVGKPKYYRDLRFKSLLDHEIGTHYLRSENMRNMDEDLRASIKKYR